jgi:MFS family permease
MDASSELVHSLLPVFMVTTLGATATSVGVIEGIAEATALIVRIFSGAFSDLLGKRKLLTVIGYGLAAITKPLFPLADTIGLVLAARFIDRIGKGIRGAPRDALIGEIAPPEIRGACFGLRQSLDTVGAFLGPLVAMLAMLMMDNDIRAVLWIAVVPAFIAVAVLVFGVREPETARLPGHDRIPIHLRDIRHVGRAYWQLVGLAGLLTLARFSEAFLVLKARAIGLPFAYVPAILIIMNIVYSLSAYPVGILSDRSGRSNVLLAGVFFLLVADLALGMASGLWMLALGVVFWGLHMGFTQGMFATMITDTTPAELRGTAYGVFNLVCGITILMASVIAGVLWDTFGSSATFYAGAIFTGGALIGLIRFRPPS